MPFSPACAGVAVTYSLRADASASTQSERTLAARPQRKPTESRRESRVHAIAITRADGTSDVLGAAQWTTWTRNAHHEISARDGPARSLAYAVMRALLRILDSKFLSRVGNFDVLVKVVGLGATIVIAIVLVAAGVVEVAGWIPLCVSRSGRCSRRC